MDNAKWRIKLINAVTKLKMNQLCGIKFKIYYTNMNRWQLVQLQINLIYNLHFVLKVDNDKAQNAKMKTKIDLMIFWCNSWNKIPNKKYLFLRPLQNKKLHTELTKLSPVKAAIKTLKPAGQYRCPRVGTTKEIKDTYFDEWNNPTIRIVLYK